jgi:thioredoxin 1
VYFNDRTPIPETSGEVYKVSNSAELRGLLSSTSNVVVDFYADWCPPCRAIAPVFSRLADEHSAKGRLAFAKVNVDHVQDAAKEFGVTAMPTFLFFQNGKPKGVAVDGVTARSSVVMSGDGLVEQVRGADKAVLEAAVLALAAKSKGKGSK